MIGWLATAKTAVAAHSWFLPWIGGAAVIAFLAGAGSGGWAAWKIQDGRVARAENTTLTLQRDIAAATAATELLARERTSAAEAALRERDQAITAAVDAIPGEVAAMIGPLRVDLRRLIDAPEYDCLRTVPLPEPYLDRLRRPAGSARAQID